MLLALFLTVVFFAGRTTFNEQLLRVRSEAQTIAQSVVATASAGHLDRTTIVAAIEHLPVPRDGVIAVVDMPSREVAAARGPAIVIEDIRGEAWPDVMIHEDLDGEGRAYGSALSADGKCRVIVGLPRRIAWEYTRPIYRRNAVGAALWYLVSIAVLFFQLSHWVRGVSRLEAIAARVISGDLATPARHVMPTSELEQMQSSMIDMIDRVRELQKQVVRQERLAAIGTLVSGVAHEISNPLQSILGSTEVIQASPDLPESLRADLSVIQQESTRAGAIIRNLTRFTRQQTTGPVPMRLTEIVTWLTELWHRRLVEQGVAFEVDDQSTRTADAVASEIQQVALNFLVNAEHAVLQRDAPTRRMIVRTRDTADGGLRFEVEDSGPGVPSEMEKQLFVPFFTTKPVGEGTGLGLSVSYGIIHSHGGTIGYQRGAMGGALFYFEIPATPE